MNIREKMQLFHQNPVVSWHEHVSGIMKDRGAEGDRLDVEACDAQMEVVDFLGIDKIVVSKPIPMDRHAPPEKWRRVNDLVYEAVQRYPGRIYGMAFVNPGYCDAMRDEIDRCVNELGFVGVKLYHHYFMDDPAQYALVEKCIDHDIPILMHSAHLTDPLTQRRQPRCTDGVHMANIARRYPEATFIMGHIGGGGDWKWSVKAIADCSNVFADIGGSIHDRPLVEESVRYLGADRMLFATDGMWSSSVSKILDAEISEEEKKTILAGRAFTRFLDKAGK